MTDKRTKAEILTDLGYTEVALDQAREREQQAQARAKRIDDEWQKRFDSLDPEARALAACVQAIEHMNAKRDRQPNYFVPTASGYRFDPHTGTPMPEPPPPPIGSSSVGRIILHLAARYGVDLGGAS